jgi:primosomal protein N'
LSEDEPPHHLSLIKQRLKKALGGRSSADITSARWSKVIRSVTPDEIDEAVSSGLVRIQLAAKPLPKPARNPSLRFDEDKLHGLFAETGDEDVLAAAGFLQTIWPLSIRQINLKNIMELTAAQLRQLSGHHSREAAEPNRSVAARALKRALPAEAALDHAQVAGLAFFDGIHARHRLRVKTVSADITSAVEAAYSHALHSWNCSRPLLIIVPDYYHLQRLMRRLMPIEGSVFLHSDAMSRGEDAALHASLASGETTTVVGRRSALYLAARVQFERILILDAGSEYMRSPEAPRVSAVDAALVLSEVLGVNVSLYFYSPHPLCLGAGLEKTSATKWQLVAAAEEKPALTEESEEPLVGPPMLLEEARSEATSKIAEQIALIAARHSPLLVLQQALGTTSGVFCVRCYSPVPCPECGRALHRRAEKGLYVCHFCGFSAADVTCAECGGSDVSFRNWGVESLYEALGERLGAEVGWLSTEALPSDRLILPRKKVVVATTYAFTYEWDFQPEAVAFVRPETHWTGTAFRGPFARLDFLARPLARFPSIASSYIITDWGDHPVFTALAAGDLRDFLAQEMELRRKFKLVPYAERVEVTIRARNATIVTAARASIIEAMRSDGALVLAGGPVRTRKVRRKNIELKVAATYKDCTPNLLREAIRAARERAEVVPEVFYF